MRSNQFECKRCGERKIKFIDRKNANVCSCGFTMNIYKKEARRPEMPVEILHVPMEFADEGEETQEFDISNLLMINDNEDDGCEEEEEDECC